MKTILATGCAVAAAAMATSAATIENPWSGVSGDRGNMIGFAFRADAGNYPASVSPAGALTPAFALDSLTFYRPNDTMALAIGNNPGQLTSTATPVFLDVYTSWDSGTSFSGYLGSSSTSVTWDDVAQDAPYSFSFNALNLAANQKYWFVFSEDNAEGEVSSFRLKLNTSGDNLTPGPGKGYLVNDLVQSLTSAAVSQDWAFAYTAGFTPIPEPTVTALGMLGCALFVFRRR